MASSSSSSYPLSDPIVVKDTGDVVVYQYPVNSSHQQLDHTRSNGVEYFDTKRGGRYYDEEGGADDHSLAAQDALQLEQDRYLDPDLPYVIQTQRKRRRRRILLGAAMCLLIGIIVLTSVLAGRNKSVDRNQAEIGDGSGVSSVVEGSEGAGGGNLVVPIGTPAPSVAAPVASISVTFAPTSSPTGSSTANAVMSTLGPVVADPSLLLDPTASEGQAYAAVMAENLSDPKAILQRYSLLTLYFASQGSDWVQKSGWNTPGSDACTWYGTGCNANGEVTNLNLSNNRLIGTLPQDVCLMTSIENFIAPANDLVGTFPDCFGNMVALQELHLTGNFLEGLPKTLYSLPDLERLSLAANDFGGSLSQLWSGAQDEEDIFPKLQTLDLHSNRLSGDIPDTGLARLKSLKAMNIFNNLALSGSLNTMCSSVNVLITTADCDISCSCCQNCPKTSSRNGN